MEAYASTKKKRKTEQEITKAVFKCENIGNKRLARCMRGELSNIPVDMIMGRMSVF